VFRRLAFWKNFAKSGVQVFGQPNPKKPVVAGLTNKKSAVSHDELIVSTTVD
jgi:hypothetical protein